MNYGGIFMALTQYIIKRLLGIIPVVLVITLFVFLMIHLTPGDPVSIMLKANNEQMVGADRIEEIRESLGLNDPLYIQYGKFLWKALHGDLGKSFYTGQDVFETISQKLPATAVLTVFTLIITVLIAIPVGVLSATKRYSFIDYISMFAALIGVSVPSFWLGLMIMQLFALKLHLLPATGMGSLDQGLWNYLKYIIMPAMTLGLGLAAVLVRLTRSSMLEVLNTDYIRTARAKGLSERMVIYKHALKNALIPIITIIGIQFGTLLGGAVITETIFAWPGIGRLAVTAIQRRDYPMIQGDVLIISTLFVLVNLIVDITYALIDPKIRYD